MILIDGKVVNNELLIVERLQAYALEEAGLDVRLDQNLMGTQVTARWDTLEWIESCAYTKYVKKYAVADATGKVSNPIEFVFQVNVVAPEIVFNETSVTSTCHERVSSVIPFEDNELRVPSLSGGCFSDVFDDVSFLDTISTSLSSSGQCSIAPIQREWSLRAPTGAETEAHDAELFASPDCASLLVSLVSPIEETIALCEEDVENTAIPDQCMVSPLRITGFEDLSLTGLPKLNILPNGLVSLQKDEILSVNTTTVATIENIASGLDVSYVYENDLVADSFKIMDMSGTQSSSSLLESVFFIDDDTIGHGVVPPDALGEYVDLCQENTIVSFRVRARPQSSKSSSDRSLRHHGNNIMSKKGYYEEFVLCFQAVCGNQDDDSVVEGSATNGRRALLARRDEHVRQLKRDSVTATIKTSREDVMRKLRNAPSVDVYERAKQEIARNLAQRRRLKEAGLLVS
eukprot:scaffold236_cov245-Amphora_coffeaeformis.AAC.1